MAGGRMHIPYTTPLDSSLAISYRNHQKNLAYFSHLSPSVMFFFTKRQSQKGDRHGTMSSPRNTLLWTAFRQWEALGYLITLIGRAKKRSSRPQMSCFHWKYRYNEEQKKDMHVLRCSVIPWKYRWENKKRSWLFVMRPPIFYDALGFSLPGPCVNPALCLQPIFSLSTCDMSNLCGLQTHGSCF